ncbi:MAG TPA: hypothetical protein VFK58_06420 [Sphingomicrobium sp.]|nr:hypothetical protein [Sphingomicrobium sp.]
MIRTLAGAAAGVAAAIVTMMLVEALGFRLFPPPPVDIQDPNSPMALPVVNQLFPILAWFLATLVGGSLAIWMSGRDWTSWLVAGSVVVGATIDFLLGRHPLWVMIAGPLAPLVAAWLAQRLSRRRLRASE